MNKLKFAFLFLFSIHLFAQNSNQLENKFDEKMDYKRKVYERTSIFIEQNPNSPGIAGLYFNLAEMSTEIDVDNPKKIAEFYQKVLEHDPNFVYQDVVLYNIGYFVFEAKKNERDNARYQNISLVINWPDSLRLSEAKLQTSINSYKSIEENFPYSEYHSQALYCLGSVYFELAIDSRNPQEYYEKALYYFGLVANKKGDELQYHGLFQRGWTYFTSGNFIAAIDDFTKILEIINNNSLRMGKMFFEADAIENMAFSLSEYDTDFVEQSIAAEKAREIFSSFVSEEYGRKIILEAIDLKLELNAPMQAIDLYNALIDIYPRNINCPNYIDSIITIYKRFSSMTRNNVSAKDLIIKENKRIRENFTTQSEWFIENSEKDISSQLALIRQSYEFIAPKYYNKFVASNDENDFIKFEKLVDEFCKYDLFEDDFVKEKKQEFRKQVVELALHLAEFSQNPLHYFNVIKRYRNFNSVYPNHEKLFDFKENIFICQETIYDLLLPNIEEEIFIDTLQNIVLDKSGLDSLYIVASTDYENLLSNAKLNKDRKLEKIRTIYKRANIRFDRNDLDSAFVDFDKLLELKIEKEIKKICYVKKAEISEKREDFASAEKFYNKAAKYSSKSEKKNLEQNALASISSAAESLLKKGDAEIAATEYLRLAKELKKNELDKSIAYLLRAIKVYKNIGNYPKAIELYLQIASYKEIKNEMLAAFKGAWSITDSLAENSDSLSNQVVEYWQQSEKLREKFIKKYPNSNEAYILRRQIIGFYENEQFNDKEKATKMYLKLHEDADELNIGDDSKEQIFAKAILINEELGNENEMIDLIIQFEKMYPNYSATEGLVSKIANIYIAHQDVDALMHFERMYPLNPNADVALRNVANIYLDSGDTDLMLEFQRKYPNHDAVEILLNEVAKLYNESGDVAKMLSFEKEFPKHSASLELLKTVAQIYSENDEEEKLEELARVIKKIDPNFDLLRQLAINKLTEISLEIDSLFTAEKYPMLLEKIEEFKITDNHYRKDDIELDLTDYYVRYEYFINYVDFYDRFTEKLNSFQTDFLDASPQELLRVNELTEWKKHLNSGASRVAKLTEKCDRYSEEMIALIKEGATFQLKTEEKTKALYYVAKVYDYGMEIILTQMTKFINVSNQLNAGEIAQNPVTQKQWKANVWKKAQEFAMEFKKKSYRYYDYLLRNFFDDTDYSDEWTNLALDRLIEWKQRSPKIYIYTQTNSEWLQNNIQIDDIDFAVEIDSLWENVIELQTSAIIDSAKNIEISSSFKTYLIRDFESVIKPEKITVNYAYQAPIDVYLNGVKLEKEHTIQDTLKDEFQFSCNSIHHLQNGKNTIILAINRDSASSDTTEFAANFVMQYDEEKYTFARSTEKKVLFSDFSWLTKTNIVSDSVFAPDSTWAVADSAKFSFYKNQMFGMQDTKAMEIWSSKIDTTKSQIVYFAKEFNIDTEFVSASAKYIGQKTVSIWINKEEIVLNQNIVFDKRLNQVQAQNVEITQLKKGKNTVFVRVDGDVAFKGFIFEMDYVIEKIDETIDNNSEVPKSESGGGE